MSQSNQWYRGGDVPQTISERYDRDLVPFIFKPWAVDLVARAALRPGDHVLDVACGTGVVAFEACRVDGVTVTGVDLNPGMLAVARTHDSEGSIDWRDGSVQALPFGDESFTAALCQQGLQYFPERASALREMRRVLATDGRLALSVWRSVDRSPGFKVLGQLAARYLGLASEVPPPFVLGDGEGLAAEVEAAGFHNVKSEAASKLLRYPSVEVLGIGFMEASPLAEAWSHLDEQQRAAFTSDLRSMLAAVGISAESSQDATVVFPIETQYITALV